MKRIPFRLHFTVFFSLLLSILAEAQELSDNEAVLNQKLESIAESQQTEDIDGNPLGEQIAYFLKHPLNLNTASKEELSQLCLLNEIQVSALLQHLEKHGKLLSLYELQSIDYFDTETIRSIFPYVSASSIAEPEFSYKEMFRFGKQTISTRYSRVLEKQKGFSSSSTHYVGSPEKLLLRYQFSYGNHIRWGITGEKDPGEAFFRKPQKQGFDFYSAHFYLKNIGVIRSMVIGDYVAGFGEGLMLWSSLSFSKTSDVLGIKKYNMGIVPYTSLDENLFFRGVGICLGQKNIAFTLFYSFHHIDANITDTLNNGKVIRVSSLQQTGLHSIPSEIFDKHSISQQVIGTDLSWNKKKFSLGITGMSTTLSAELQRGLSPYNQFSFIGKNLLNAGTHYHAFIKNLSLFGENAFSSSFTAPFAWATVNGILLAPDPRVTLSLLFRNYQRNYQSLFSNSFSESSGTANEKGLYTAINFKLREKLNLSCFYDRFLFPWLKYQVDAPSYGNEFLAQISFTPNKKTEMYFRFKQKEKMKNISVVPGPDYLDIIKTQDYRFHIGTEINPKIKLLSRLELLEVNDEKGFLLYQEINYRGKLGICLRYALFDTKSYDSRIYSYESDVPGSFSIPSYYYKGSRVYVLLSCRINQKMEAWLRCSQTFYSNKNIISEGSLTEIDGNTKTEIKAQWSMTF